MSTQHKGVHEFQALKGVDAEISLGDKAFLEIQSASFQAYSVNGLHQSFGPLGYAATAQQISATVQGLINTLAKAGLLPRV